VRTRPSPRRRNGEALVEREALELGRRSHGRHLPVPGRDAVGQVDGLEARARGHHRLQSAPPDTCRLREAHPSNAGKRVGLGGQRDGEAGVVEPREAQEEAEHARERLPPERPREASTNARQARRHNLR
jgi:hypothetical protein